MILTRAWIQTTQPRIQYIVYPCVYPHMDSAWWQHYNLIVVGWGGEAGNSENDCHASIPLVWLARRAMSKNWLKFFMDFSGLQLQVICFSDVNSEGGDIKFVASQIPFPSSDIGNTVQGWYYCREWLNNFLSVTTCTVLLKWIKEVWLRKEKQGC